MGMHPTGQGDGGASGSGSLREGSNLGEFTVRRVAEGRLTLRGSRTFAAKAIALGTVLLVVGLCAWAAVLRHDLTPRVKLLLAPLGGVILIFVGLSRLGETWELDAKSRVLVIFGLMSHKVLRPGFFKCVRLTALPTNMDQRETLVLDLVVSDRIWYRVGRRRTNKADAANLILAARQIATMLGLPIEVEGTLESALPSLREQFASAAHTAASRPLDRAA